MRSHDEPGRTGLQSHVFHHSPRLAAALALGAALLGTSAARSQSSVVSPAAQAIYEGSSSTSYPLGRANARVQQLHADLGTASRTITGHAYRRDATSLRGQLAAYQVEMTVTMSMSPRTPEQASTTFAENAGAQVIRPQPDIPFEDEDLLAAGMVVRRVAGSRVELEHDGGRPVCLLVEAQHLDRDARHPRLDQRLPCHLVAADNLVCLRNRAGWRIHGHVLLA